MKKKQITTSNKAKSKRKEHKKQPPLVHLPPFTVQKVVSQLSETMQWGLTLLNVPNAWKITQGDDITVMVIDTGYSNHIDLDGAMVYEKCKSFIPGENINDANGHSTHCCGIIGARQNDIGCVGVAPKCNIITCKVLGSDGTGTIDGINAALEYAIKIKPDVISMSLGAAEGDATEHNLIKKLYDMNVPIIAAAGNEGGAKAKRNTINYPGKYEEVICVAAIDQNKNAADFSSWGDEVDIAGPGVNIYSTYLAGQYAKLSGTSMATPFIAGVVVLLISKHRKQERETGKNDCVTVEQIKEHLYKYHLHTGQINTKNPSTGYGIIDPVGLLYETANVDPVVIPPIVPKLSWWQRFLSWLRFQ